VIEQIERDVLAAPDAFDLAGPVDRAHVERALIALAHPATESLRELWTTFGGGEMFETEELLGPVASAVYGLEERNAELTRSGLSPDLLVFHAGLHVTAVSKDGGVVVLDPDSLVVVRTLGSLGDWYRDLRSEYGASYGLTPD
jgi:hypothetical protein